MSADNRAMPAITLNTHERREKRADAHHLTPVVLIGGDGLTPAVVKETDAALNAHGLIKVRVFSDDRTSRESILATLTDQLNAAPVQHIGKLLVLWRPIPPKEQTEREDRMPGPRVVKLLKFSKSGNHRPQVKKIKVLGNERVAAGGEIKRARKRVTSIKRKVVE
jgi:RNA-binding protein